jgi:hypothetical protein
MKQPSALGAIFVGGEQGEQPSHLTFVVNFPLPPCTIRNRAPLRSTVRNQIAHLPKDGMLAIG